MHDNLMIHEDAVLRWCKKFLEDYKHATTPSTRCLLLILVAWTPPRAGLFKVNTNAAFD